jgi:F-type H+-transporting ATPase subunit delta
LFDVALKEADVEQAGRDLASVAELLRQFPDLDRVLTTPAVPAARKAAAITALLPRLALSSPVAKLLVLLADRDRLDLLPELTEAYRERLMEHQHVMTAEITTAEPLAADRLAQLQQRLAQATGYSITVTTRVDPELIGGIVTRIGGVVYDGSLATQLTRFRDRMIAQG